MKFLFPLLLAVLTLFALVACSGEDRSTPDYNPVVGPFDKDGNYVEAWADNPPPPSKKSWFHREKKPKDEPVPTPTPTPTPQYVSNNTPVPQQVVNYRQVTPEPVQRPETVRVSKPVYTPKPVVQSKPKPVVQAKAKPKPTPKSAPSRSHKVVKGDTLYNISNRYGTSVSALQKANNISGTNIRIGQTLKIP